MCKPLDDLPVATFNFKYRSRSKSTYGIPPKTSRIAV
jgi:hypothetical protein